MKKKYIKPAMKVYEIETPQLLAGSQEFYNNSVVPGDGNDEMW